MTRIDGPSRAATSEAAHALGIDSSRLPKHVAIIMDGNGRWAKARGLPRTAGHDAGEAALLDTVRGAVEIGIEWLTVYAFSTENWRRPIDEVRFLMGFNERLLVNRRDELHEMGVRVRFIGRRGGRVPRRVLRHIDDTEALTERNRGLQFNIAFNYGGRVEIVDACRQIARAVESGHMTSGDVDERLVRRSMYLPEMPDVDLAIRTSAEQRVSNFLIWQTAYAEWMFPEVLWPDFRRTHLHDAIRTYQSRDRRFGGVDPSAQPST